MTWLEYPIYVYLTSSLWIAGLLLLWIPKTYRFHLLADILVIGGIISLGYFLTALWISLERPPFRTLAETRLWYSMFLSVIGLIIYYRWKLRWMLVYTLLLSILFLFINYLNPDTFDKTLMPALQSPWFVPHVVVYIIAYALLAVSSLIGIKGLVIMRMKKQITGTINLADNIVYIGFAFLTFGLLFGALWAKEAWGNYWTWDPKETWAFLTWMVYLLYIHFRVRKRMNVNTALWVLSLSFVILLICWFGVNYLPSTQSSVHVYSS